MEDRLGHSRAEDEEKRGDALSTEAKAFRAGAVGLSCAGAVAGPGPGAGMGGRSALGTRDGAVLPALEGARFGSWRPGSPSEPYSAVQCSAVECVWGDICMSNGLGMKTRKKLL